jgi:hypothetical protein
MKYFLLLLTFLISFNGFSQQKVTGKVSSTTNEMLEGVSIKVKGSSVGTITDQGGNFSLTLPRDRQTLVFSIVGFQTKEKLLVNKL